MAVPVCNFSKIVEFILHSIYTKSKHTIGLKTHWEIIDKFYNKSQFGVVSYFLSLFSDFRRITNRQMVFFLFIQQKQQFSNKMVECQSSNFSD